MFKNQLVSNPDHTMWLARDMSLPSRIEISEHGKPDYQVLFMVESYLEIQETQWIYWHYCQWLGIGISLTGQDLLPA
jgi:hypothetical protein